MGASLSDGLNFLASTGAALLVIAAVLKLRRPQPGARALELLHLPASFVVVRFVALAELLVGAAWLAWPSRATGASLSATYLIFLGISAALVRGSDQATPCGCMGRDDTRISTAHFLYNGALVLASAGSSGLVAHSAPGLPGHPLLLAVYLAELGCATWLSYLLLTDFQNATRPLDQHPQERWAANRLQAERR
jgi:hypothetical protein